MRREKNKGRKTKKRNKSSTGKEKRELKKFARWLVQFSKFHRTAITCRDIKFSECDVVIIKKEENV